MKLLLQLLLLSAAAMPIQLPEFLANEKFRFLYNEPYRSVPLQIIYGGASSGKSSDIAQRYVIDAVNEPRNFLIVKNTANTIRDSVFAELEKAIVRLKVRELFDISASALVITYKPRGNRFFFRGLDDTEKLKGVVPAVGVLTDEWFEEATEMSEKDVDDVGLRMRGLAPVVKRQVLSFNPIFCTHWISKRHFQGRLLKYYNDGRKLILHSTHRDNAFLAPEDHARIGAYTGYHHDVYDEGRWGVLGKVIYANWRVDDLDEKNYGDFRYGLDFGFAGSAAACHKYAYQRDAKKIFVLGEVYGHGMTNDVLAARIRPLVGNNVVRADSEDPKSIAELQADKKHQVNAVGVKKGPDSVLHGIQWLQQHEIIVDRRCQEMQNELSTYQWKKDKAGNAIPEPVKVNDHCLDDMRYAFEDEMSFEGTPDIYIR